MKTERRHELQTNILADWLGEHYKQIQPYAKTILAVVLIAVGVLVVYLFISASQRANAGSGWGDYYAARNQRSVTELKRVADDFPGTPAAMWALQSAADLELSQGSSMLYMNRDDATKPLKSAVELYQQVLDEALGQNMLQQRAAFGMAQASECLSVADGSKAKNKEYLADARKYYDRVARDATGGPVAKAAAERLQQLSELTGDDDESANNFYWWFASQEPVRRTPPSSQFPPASMADLPDRPNLDPLFTPTNDDPGSGIPNGPPPLGLDPPSPNPGSETPVPPDAYSPAPVSDPPAPKLDAAKPDAAKPDAAKPDAAKPDAAKPDAAKPDAAKPDAAKPDSSDS